MPLPSDTGGAVMLSSLIPCWLIAPILVSSSFSCSGGFSSSFTSLSFTILGGVNLAISTLGGSTFGGGGGGGSFFFSSFTSSSCTSSTTIAAFFGPPLKFDTNQPMNNNKMMINVPAIAVTIRLL